MSETQKRVLAEVLTELLLTLLPVIALLFVLLGSGELSNLPYHEEWLFIATVLYAQTLVKLRKTARSPLRLRHARIDLLSVLVLVLFIPSIVLLCYMAWVEDHSTTIAVCLVALFALSLVAFILSSLFAARVAKD